MGAGIDRIPGATGIATGTAAGGTGNVVVVVVVVVGPVVLEEEEVLVAIGVMLLALA